MLVMLALDDPDKTHAVLDAWLTVGVFGLNLLDSTGLPQPCEHERNAG